MFAKAIEIASKYTFPVISSKKLMNGTVSCGYASFIVINQQGWILTAAHVFNDLILFQQHQSEIAVYESKRQFINDDATLLFKQKRKQLARLSRDNEWITNYSLWWASIGLNISSIQIDKLADLAIGKIESFDPTKISGYPVFRDPSKGIPVGTSLCRLGFPFHEITATFDDATGNFTIANGVLPIPRFPNDGIHTRIGKAIDQNGREVNFLETSTPGLRGQSGGPIFDVDGNVCAIQSQTVHLPLGFSPAVKAGNKQIVEHQFMRVGLGAHVEEIVKFLNSHGIVFLLSTL
jgi:hypothetical protein